MKFPRGVRRREASSNACAGTVAQGIKSRVAWNHGDLLSALPFRFFASLSHFLWDQITQYSPLPTLCHFPRDNSKSTTRGWIGLLPLNATTNRLVAVLRSTGFSRALKSVGWLGETCWTLSQEPESQNSVVSVHCNYSGAHQLLLIHAVLTGEENCPNGPERPILVSTPGPYINSDEYLLWFSLWHKSHHFIWRLFTPIVHAGSDEELRHRQLANGRPQENQSYILCIVTIGFLTCEDLGPLV
jgi:hypothetical protein